MDLEAALHKFEDKALKSLDNHFLAISQLLAQLRDQFHTPHGRQDGSDNFGLSMKARSQSLHIPERCTLLETAVVPADGCEYYYGSEGDRAQNSMRLLNRQCIKPRAYKEAELGAYAESPRRKALFQVTHKADLSFLLNGRIDSHNPPNPCHGGVLQGLDCTLKHYGMGLPQMIELSCGSRSCTMFQGLYKKLWISDRQISPFYSDSQLLRVGIG